MVVVGGGVNLCQAINVGYHLELQLLEHHSEETYFSNPEGLKGMKPYGPRGGSPRSRGGSPRSSTGGGLPKRRGKHKFF